MVSANLNFDDYDDIEMWIPIPLSDNPRDFLSEEEIASFESFYEEKAPALLPKNSVREQNRSYSVIAAARGDDFAAITDCADYGLAYLQGMRTQELKISWKDVNISSNSVFYAESLILLPATARMHWEYTLRREKGRDVPLILDPVQLKSLSPVRKQTNIETDLPSKMRLLSTRARWCDKRGIAYHFHQHALLLGLCIFDFEDSFQFPFLHEQNGGCGGAPPYRNPDTGFCALFHHNRGGMKKAVLGVMREATAVNNCKLAVKDAIFLPWIYQAQSGDREWLQAVSTARQAKYEGYSQSEIMQLIKNEAASPFPDELQDRLITIEVDNPLMGSTISRMRNLGMIYTKLDVTERMANRKRDEALYGEDSMGDVMRDIDKFKKEARSSSLRLIRDLLSAHEPMKIEALDSVPDDRDGQIKIMNDYYHDFDDGNTSLSSLCFSEKVEIIHAKAVEEFLGESSSQILRDSIGIGVDNQYAQLYRNSIANIENIQEAENWLLEIERGKRPMPPVGFGTRDSHILLAISHAMKAYKKLGIVIVTSDRPLVNNCRKWVHYMRQDPECLCQYPGVAQISSETLLAQSLVNGHLVPSKKRINLTDPRTRKPFPMTRALYESLVFRTNCDSREKDRPWIIIYDEPNIARRTANMRVKGGKRDRRLAVISSGGLDSSALEDHPDWVNWPTKELHRDPLFSRVTRGKVRRVNYYLDFHSVVSSYSEWDVVL